jgi:rod shape-determining protein MreC
LQELYDLDQQYADYETTGAHVIAKGTSNWFDTFTIDKGSDDGIEVNMNVIAGSGLVGIVTEVGPGYSVVKSIINDSSAVSAMILDTSDNCIISGDLESMTSSNTILLSNLEDTEDSVSEGTSVVTSNISNKYLPGILIGYVTDIESDANGLTKSGTITPVVDFKHLQDVLVILETKETGE